MENYKVRKCINDLDELIDISIPCEEQKNAFRSCIDHNKELMIIMRKSTGDYTDEDLEKFQNHVLEFFQGWVNLYGRLGVTNYTHMIGVGHMLGYMRKYKNLNKYSQQGWEALNALIRLFFFRRTNKGGKNSGGEMTSLKSKLVPIGCLLQRRLVWVCNLVPDDLFDNNFVMPVVTTNQHSTSLQTDGEDNNEDIIFDSDLASNCY